MMRMMMRPQKSQLPVGNLIYTANGTFDRVKICMFGYTDYEALLIGGSGGRSGSCDASASGRNAHVYPSAGGGGGMLRFKGKMMDLSAQTVIAVGAAGGAGSDSGNNVKAGNGSSGGPSVFNSKIAYGGSGGIGGKCNITSSSDLAINPGQGGAGGTNGESLGVAGVGGFTADLDISGGFALSSQGAQATNGTAQNGSGDIIAGGCGGGGGAGEVSAFGETPQTARTGGAGSSTILAYYSAASPSSGNQGGNGGGANVLSIAGVVDYYGNAGSGRHGSGVVIIKPS